jgi:hypothetical protein
VELEHRRCRNERETSRALRAARLGRERVARGITGVLDDENRWAVASPAAAWSRPDQAMVVNAVPLHHHVMITQ